MTEVHVFDEADVLAASTEDDVDMEAQIFELIRRVGNRRLLFDSKDPDHKSRNKVSLAWDEICKGIILDGKPATGKTSREKWRHLRDYYNKRKREMKGKSGDGVTGKKQWTYFKAMDEILRTCSDENSNTTTNLEEDTPTDKPVEDASNLEKNNNGEENAENEVSTKTPITSTPASREPLKKRRRLSEEPQTTQFLELLKATGKDEDEFYHFGMNIAAKIRKLRKGEAAKAQHEISGVLLKYELDEDLLVDD